MKSALRIIIFVLAMGTVSGGLLAGINAITAERIAKNEELRLKSAILDALEIIYDNDSALNVFAENVEILKKGDSVFYRAKDGGTAFEFRGPGLWGVIEVIAGINADLKTIRAIRILRQEETPGLGSRIAEREYLSQFKHKEFIPRLIFVPQGQSQSVNEVDAITGATGSSKALEKLLNEVMIKNINILKNNA